MSNLYENDFYAWTQQQAALLSERKFSEIDLNNLLEEVDSMGRSEKRTLRSRIEILLLHLLKWRYQPTLRSRSWHLTIKEQRKRLARHLSENPSLKKQVDEEFLFAYEVAIYEAAKETGFDEHFFPRQCEWTIQQILDEQFLPMEDENIEGK